MPTFRITLPSGRRFRITRDQPPDDAFINQLKLDVGDSGAPYRPMVPDSPLQPVGSGIETTVPGLEQNPFPVEPGAPAPGPVPEPHGLVASGLSAAGFPGAAEKVSAVDAFLPDLAKSAATKVGAGFEQAVTGLGPAGPVLASLANPALGPSLALGALTNPREPVAGAVGAVRGAWEDAIPPFLSAENLLVMGLTEGTGAAATRAKSLAAGAPALKAMLSDAARMGEVGEVAKHAQVLQQMERALGKAQMLAKIGNTIQMVTALGMGGKGVDDAWEAAARGDWREFAQSMAGVAMAAGMGAHARFTGKSLPGKMPETDVVPFKAQAKAARAESLGEEAVQDYRARRQPAATAPGEEPPGLSTRADETLQIAQEAERAKRLLGMAEAGTLVLDPETIAALQVDAAKGKPSAPEPPPPAPGQDLFDLGRERLLRAQAADVAARTQLDQAKAARAQAPHGQKSQAKRAQVVANKAAVQAAQELKGAQDALTGLHDWFEASSPRPGGPIPPRIDPGEAPPTPNYTPLAQPAVPTGQPVPVEGRLSTAPEVLSQHSLPRLIEEARKLQADIEGLRAQEGQTQQGPGVTRPLVDSEAIRLKEAELARVEAFIKGEEQPPLEDPSSLGPRGRQPISQPGAPPPPVEVAAPAEPGAPPPRATIAEGVQGGPGLDLSEPTGPRTEPGEPPAPPTRLEIQAAAARERLRAQAQRLGKGSPQAGGLGEAGKTIRDMAIVGAAELERLGKKDRGTWEKRIEREFGKLPTQVLDKMWQASQGGMPAPASQPGQAPPGGTTASPPGTPPPGAPSKPGAPPPAAARQPGQGFTIPEETWLETRQRKNQDKLNRVSVTQKALTEQGGTVREASDVALAADAFGHKAAEKLADVDRQMVDPLIKHLAKEGVPLEDLGDYMTLLHAPERDALIAKRTEGKVTTGSGWLPGEQATRWKELEAKYGPRNMSGTLGPLEKAADLVRDMRTEQLKVLTDSGLLSPEEAKAWRDTLGENYVPLRKFDVDAGPGTGTGMGFDITGKESQGATGRSTHADNPVVFMEQQLERSIVRGEKNQVAQALGRLITENPDPELWAIDKKHVKNELVDGKVKQVRDWHAEQQDIQFKINGESHRIYLADPIFKRAIENMSAAETGELLRTIGKGTRFYSQMATTFSPPFMFTNFARDLPEAVINTAAEHGVSTAAKVAKNALPSIRAMWRVLKDPQAPGKLEQYAREFRADGGSTGFYTLKTIPELEAALKGRWKTAGPGAIPAMQRVAHGLLAWIEDMNKSVENGTRLSTYVALREKGFSRARAAQGAREVTLNFGKKGENSTAIGSMFAFFNANVQGTVRLAQILKKPMGAAVGASLVGLGFEMDLYNRAMAGDNDKDGTNDYDAIPEYVKERNLVFMRGEGKTPILWPMPYGFGILHNLGRNVSGVVSGAKKPGAAARSFAGAAYNAFNPLGGESDLIQALSPTLLDPLVQDVENKDFTGRPIRPETFPGAPEKPPSEMFFRNVPPLARAVAAKLNTVTGGDAVTPGYISVSPETLQHYFQFATGGLGRFGSQVASTAQDLLQGKKPSLRNTPVLNRFAYEQSPGYQGQVFKQNMQEIENLWGRFKSYKTGGQAEKAKEIPRALLEVRPLLSATLQRIRDLREAAADSGKNVDAQVEELQRRANKAVAEAREKAEGKPKAMGYGPGASPPTP